MPARKNLSLEIDDNFVTLFDVFSGGTKPRRISSPDLGSYRLVRFTLNQSIEINNNESKNNEEEKKKTASDSQFIFSRINLIITTKTRARLALAWVINYCTVC